MCQKPVSAYSVIILLGPWIWNLSHLWLPSLSATVLNSQYHTVSTCSVFNVHLFCMTSRGSTKISGWKLQGSRFCLHIRKNFLILWAIWIGMGCLQRSWVLYTEGVWIAVTWLIAENVEGIVLTSDVVFTRWFLESLLILQASDSREDSVSPARFPWDRKTILLFFYIPA